MFRKRTAFALGALLIIMPEIGITAQNVDRSVVVKQMAARIGRVVGAASACREIARPRIKTISDKFTEIVRNLGAADNERMNALQIFEGSLSEAQRAVMAREIECSTAEHDLASLEHAANITTTPLPQPQASLLETAVIGQSTPLPSPVVAPSQASLTPNRGISDREIRFGMAAAFTGASRELGRQMKIGIEAAFNNANEAGVQGRTLKLETADDGYEPTRTPEAMKQLLERNQVLGFIGNIGTPTAMVAVPYALEHRSLFFGGFTGASVLRRDPPDRYVFNYRASYAEETDAVVRYLVKVKRLKPSEIAVFAQQDSFGDSGFAGVTKAMRALRGGDPGTILRMGYKRNTVDVDEAIAQLKATKNNSIKAVVMVATYRAAAKFIEKTRDTHPAIIYTNVSFVGSTALADELMLLGPRYATGVIVTQVVPAVEGYSSLILEYKAALAKYFPGEAPDYVSLEGYISANILIEALNRAGPQLDTEKIVSTLENMRDYDMGLGTTINFGKTEHQASHKIWGSELTNTGKYQAIELD